ncbi:MAG: tetratricopeptide repeat protein [Armatimonadota bacterium]
MSFWQRLFGKKVADVLPSASAVSSPAIPYAPPPETAPASSLAPVAGGNRHIRVFISSTFRDMQEERDALMTHAWPELRRFCRERYVELVEVDLRWGISEEQSSRRETLKLCLDEIRACRPYFIGLLGERYGWTPGDDAFSADLREEQPWLTDLQGKSVTELEILHGVLNNPEMAARAFFYLRDPAYTQSRGSDFLSDTATDAEKQTALKTRIRQTCEKQHIPIHENYPDPLKLAVLVLDDLKAAIEAQFPIEAVPDALTREAQDHEAFAEMRRRTYIGRVDYFATLDRHATSEGGPLVVLGESGSGKSALLANWVEHWRKTHPNDLIIQHYIGGTVDSANHWRLMTRLMLEIKRWSGDTEDVPTKHEDILKDFPLWLAKVRARAAHEGVRCILVLDALNGLDDQDHACLLGWLPEHPFSGSLRLIASTLTGTSGADDPLVTIQQRHWAELRVQPLKVEERRRMIVDYLARYSKQLDERRLDRLAATPAAANPLYLKILLDDLRVTGTFERLDERLTEYLAAADIPALLQQVLTRYQRDYEHDRPGLVAEALGLIYAARRGLAESELLQLLRPADHAQLPPAVWTPLRAALEDSLVDRGGILNFAHDFLRTAVGNAFAATKKRCKELRRHLADYFEAEPITTRTCDELPWLLKETGSKTRLRACLLDIDRFLLIQTRDEEELRRYWVEQLHEQQTMGKAYLLSFELWSREPGRRDTRISYAPTVLGLFFLNAALHAEAEPLLRRALEINEQSFGKAHPKVATALHNLSALLQATNRLAEAESLQRRARKIFEQDFGKDHPNVALELKNLAVLFHDTNRLAEAEPLIRRALTIEEQLFGTNHPNVADDLNNLALLLQDTNRHTEAEPLVRRALAIYEQSFGPTHPRVAIALNNLAQLFKAIDRLPKAEPLLRRALEIDEQAFGADHPMVAIDLNNLALLLQDTNRLTEAEPMMRRALDIAEHSLGNDHPDVARVLNNLAALLQTTNRFVEAEPLVRRALAIYEQSFGPTHPRVAIALNNLAQLFKATNRLTKAEPLLRRALEIDEQAFGIDHPKVVTALHYLAQLLQATNRLAEAEPLLRRSLAIDESCFGKDHPDVSRDLNNLAALLQATNRFIEAEPLVRRAIQIDEQAHGKDHPDVARDLNNLAALLQAINRFIEAEPLVRRALQIDEQALGKDHPDVAKCINTLTQLLRATNRSAEAEPLMQRALVIDEKRFGPDHPEVARDLNNLATLLYNLKRLAEAEPLLRRSLAINEQYFGPNHPIVASALNNLAELLKVTNRVAEAEPLSRRHLEIYLGFTRSTGYQHTQLDAAIKNYASLLKKMGRSPQEIQTQLNAIYRPFGLQL